MVVYGFDVDGFSSFEVDREYVPLEWQMSEELDCNPHSCANCSRLTCYQFDEPGCSHGHPDVWEISAGDSRVACCEKCAWLLQGWDWID